MWSLMYVNVIYIGPIASRLTKKKIKKRLTQMSMVYQD